MHKAPDMFSCTQNKWDVQQRLSTRVGYSAARAMIYHENDDCEKKNLIAYYSSTLGSTLSSDCLAGNNMGFKDVRRVRSLTLKSKSDVWVSYIHIWLILYGMLWDINIYLHAECAAYYQCLISCSNAMTDVDWVIWDGHIAFRCFFSPKYWSYNNAAVMFFVIFVHTSI